jgi:hypothetical protein
LRDPGRIRTLNRSRLPEHVVDIPRIERYLAKAKECERLATHARDPMVKATYRKLVQQWRDLAEQIRELTR